MRVVKAWGHARKGLVPDIPGTTPKACSKCGHWFAASKRYRVCAGCQPKWIKAQRPEQHKLPTNTQGHITTPGAQVGLANVQVSRGKNLASDPLIRATVRNIKSGHQDPRDLLLVERAVSRPIKEVKFVSHACSSPKEPQAEVAACDRDRRHPYNGKRPQNSGYCVVLDCACKCHRSKVES